MISDLDHFGPGDFGRLSVISDGDFGRFAVKSSFDTYIYIQYNRVCHFYFYAHHTPLRSHLADNGHTFLAKRQVHFRHCVQDNTSTIFKSMKIINDF